MYVHMYVEDLKKMNPIWQSFCFTLLEEEKADDMYVLYMYSTYLGRFAGDRLAWPSW